MLSAHTLLSSLVISLIISIILGGIILMYYQNQELWVRHQKQKRLEQNLQSVTNILLGDTANTNPDFEELDLFGNSTDSASFKKLEWGVYNFACLKSFNANETISKAFLYGTELTDTMDCCLYLVDHQLPLQLCGKTRLIGDIYIPKAGIKPTIIEGKSYDYDKLYTGRNLKSDTVFSFLDNVMVKNIYSLFNKYQRQFSRNSIRMHIPDTVINSFENETKVYLTASKGLVTKRYIRGRVILISDSLIELTSDNQLEDAIVMAPEIKVADNYKGALQLIANKKITIGKNCQIGYPSSILLIKDSINNYQGKIEIGDNCIITGIIFANSFNNDALKNVVIFKKASILKGVMYIKGMLELAGEIYGTVVTDYFLYRTQSSMYQNSLVDAVINRPMLSDHFISSTLIKKPGQLKIIKWLN